MELKRINSLATTGSYLENYLQSFNYFIKQLYIARAISIRFTASLPLQIGFLTIPITPRLTFKSFMLNIATTKNTSILRQRPMRYKRSVKSTISLQTTALHTILRRCFYQIRSGGGFIKDLRVIRIRSIGLLVGLRIQRIAAFRAQQKTSGWKSIRASIVLLHLFSLQR